MVRARLRAGLALAALLVATAPAARAGEAPPDTSRWSWAIGPTIGIPQTIGVAVEKTVTPWFRVQAHGGTILVVTSVGVRAILLPNDEWTLQPYLHGGIGTFFSIGIEDFEGVIPYSWGGIGLRLSVHRFVLWAEYSGISDGDDEFGGPLPAAGILFQFMK